MAILYVTDQGATLTKRGHRLVVEKQGRQIHWQHAFKVEQVILLGNITLSPAAIAFLLQEGIDTVFPSYYGKYRGRLVAHLGKNIDLVGGSLPPWQRSPFASAWPGLISRGKFITAGCYSAVRTGSWVARP